jgi:hypothetical protein
MPRTRRPRQGPGRPHPAWILRTVAGARVGARVRRPLSVQDYRINAEVRRFLVSRWVDVELLQLGATNGVVYLMGRLDTTLQDPSRRVDENVHRNAAERVLQLAMMLEKELRRIRDVRDVVFKLENAYKRGGRWRALDGTTATKSRTTGWTPRIDSSRRVDSTATTRAKTWKISEDGSEVADTETDA